MTTTRPHAGGTDRVADRGAGALLGETERVVALFLVGVTGLHLEVYHGITLGLVLGVMLSPVWLPEVRLHGRFAPWLMVLGSVALVWGVLLSWNSSATHAINFRQAVSFLAFLMEFVVGAAVVWWARRVLKLWVIAVVFGVGMFVDGLLGGAAQNAIIGNTWKSLIAVPLAVVALGACLRLRRRRGAELVVLLGLTGASAFLDSRSYAASFFISALLLLWQMRPTTLTKSRSVGLTTAMLVALAYGAYTLGQNLLVAGYLGANAQARTIAQIQQAGSLIYGGRPEFKATLALMSDDPWGHGVGVLPSFHDVQVAKSALSSVLYNPNNGYVDKFMFGNDIELHSVFGDLWTHFGVAGLALVALIALTSVHMVVGQVNERRATGLILYLGTWNLWNVLFSPFYSAMPTLILMFGLLDQRPPAGEARTADTTDATDLADTADIAARTGPADSSA